VVPAGLYLTAVSDSGLVWIGLAGLIVGWAYSAPPLKLQSRGLGEFGITAGWLLVVVGSDFVQRHGFSFMPVAAGLGFALLVANVLYINQFPDVKADAQAGKHTMVVRLGVQHARWGYALIALLTYGWIIAMVATGHLPWPALVSLLAAAASSGALRVLWRHAAEPAQLVPALKLTILAASLHGLLLAAVLVLAR
jgi:1,4-dihydroxy-2-naphthoate octaprenyltransferase